jgi:hypothetical protein
MFLKKFSPYFCVLPCHKYALTFVKLQGKNEKFSCSPGRGSRLNCVELGIFARWHKEYAWQNALLPDVGDRVTEEDKK